MRSRLSFRHGPLAPGAVILVLAGVTLATGCKDSAEFRLPPPPPGPEIRFQWEIWPEPVLDRGPAAWDSSDVLNPSVTRFAEGFWNLYSGFDGRRSGSRREALVLVPGWESSANRAGDLHRRGHLGSGSGAGFGDRSLARLG